MNKVVLLPDTALFALNAFDVGNNPAHVDFGLMKHQFAKKVEEHLDELSQAQAVVLSGLSLELLDEEAPELLDKVLDTIKERSLKVIGALYYDTELSLLSNELFSGQWQKTQDQFNNFHLSTSSLYTGSQAIPTTLSATLSSLQLHMVGNQSVHDSIGVYSSLSPRAQVKSELGMHIASELSAMHTHIKEDEDLHTTWQLLGNQVVQSQLQGEQPQTTYESYFTMMHILNDMAHTVRNVELTKRGKFENEAQIVDSPSQRILEVLAR